MKRLNARYQTVKKSFPKNRHVINGFLKGIKRGTNNSKCLDKIQLTLKKCFVRHLIAKDILTWLIHL